MIKTFKISKPTPLLHMKKLQGVEETGPPICSVVPGLSNPQPKCLSLSYAMPKFCDYSRKTSDDRQN